MKAVVADAIAALGAGFAASVAGFEHAQGANVIVPVSIAGVFVASGAYGFIEVRRCRVEHEQRPGWSLADMPTVM